MPEQIAASSGRWRNLAPYGDRSRNSIAAVRALCGLFVLCAGWAWNLGEAVSADRPAPSIPASETLLLKPVDSGRLSSGYGPRYNPILKRRQMHRGIDWAAPRGTRVRAAGNGVVVEIDRSGAYGRYLRIDHGRTISTVYAHLQSYAPGMRIGRRVRQGDIIGRTGSTGRATGPHLHYEVLVANRQIDPLAVRPIINAHALTQPVLEADAAELGIGGPATTIAGGTKPAHRVKPEARSLDALSLEVDGGMIRIDDLLKRKP
jgi:murein DD-endopeptidase MepM/ murein hydrolase activator NlpD